MLLNYYHQIDCTTKSSTDGRFFEVAPEHLEPIIELFSQHAVYERQDWEPITGKDEISKFFYEKRSLNGQHYVNYSDVIESKGVPLSLHSHLKKFFPNISTNNCTTVAVKGKFEGDHCVTEVKNGARTIKLVTHVNLSFNDWWVIENNNVIYRYSEITPIAKAPTPGEIATHSGRY